jgi:hypothetical protein
MPDIVSKVADRALLQECQEEYTRKILPQQLGVGVKFVAELLAMGIRITMHMRPDHILISIELKNAYNSMWRAAILESHMAHRTLRRTVSYWRAKLGPQPPIWAEDSTL